VKPGFLTDCNGKSSHTRLLVMLTVPLLVLMPLAVWAILCLRHGVMVAIEPTVPLYVSSATSIVLSYAGFKAYQEPVAPPPPAKTSNP
jgi:hypothetical protein